MNLSPIVPHKKVFSNEGNYSRAGLAEKLDDYKTEYKIATMKAIVLIGVVVCAGTKCIDKTKVNITALFVKEILLVG